MRTDRDSYHASAIRRAPAVAGLAVMVWPVSFSAGRAGEFHDAIAAGKRPEVKTHWDGVEALRKHEPDLDKKRKDGKTARELAEELKLEDIARLLSKSLGRHSDQAKTSPP